MLSINKKYVKFKFDYGIQIGCKLHYNIEINIFSIILYICKNTKWFCKFFGYSKFILLILVESYINLKDYKLESFVQKLSNFLNIMYLIENILFYFLS